MPTTLDCDLLRDLFGTPELRAVFDSRSLVRAWLHVERALAEAQAEVGIIPAAAAARISAEADPALYDFDDLRAGIAASDHPLVPLVRALSNRCGRHGRWVHWGVTTQDVIDTGFVLQAREALPILARDLKRAVDAAARLCREHAETPMAGRTHGQHAVPITFGLKAATWGDELERARQRLLEAAERVMVVQLSGAAGTLATLGPDADAVQQAFAHRVGLARGDVHWHATRDRLRDLGHGLNQLSAVAERVGTEVVRLQATEIAEVAEPLKESHVGSSTMPQKRNPMTTEYMIAGARLLRASVGVLVDSPAHLHERDMGFWAAEWIALPQSFILAGGLLDKLATVLEGLQVDATRMRANLEATRGAIMAEAVMMALGREIGHEPAHALVLAASRRAIAQDVGLLESLASDPEITDRLSEPELRRLLEPESYLGLAAASANAVARRIESLQT